MLENLSLPPAVILAGIGVILFIMFLLAGYVKAPTNIAFVISGLKKKPKVLIGRAGIRIPFFERKDELLLKQVSVDIKTDGYIPTRDFIGVQIDAVAKVRVLTAADITVDDKGEFLPNVDNQEGNKRITANMVNAAMKNFLNMDEDDIRVALTDSLQGNMREIIGTQDLKVLCNDRKQFGDEVQAKAQKDMNALGVWIESCNIQKMDDEKGLIVALGQDNMSQIQKDASIAKANAERDVAIAEAEANRAANAARVAAETAIAEENNTLAIRQAELKIQADVKKAEADMAYSIQEHEQRKSVEVASANADIAKQEREIELKQREADVREQELAATIKKQADAEKYEMEMKAEAELFRRKKEAEAERYEEEQKALAIRAAAEARRYEREQDAAGIEAVGKAEAAALREKGMAEAEALELRAEAMKQYGQAAVLEMYFNAMPEVAKYVAEPLTNIDKITMYGDGNTAKLTRDIMTTITQVTDGLKDSVGIDLQSVISGLFGAKLAESKSEPVVTVQSVEETTENEEM